MKIVMMGAGGVGGLFGGRLARAGYDVSFIARGAHLQALQRDGLRIESPALGDVHVDDVRATDDPATLGAADLVIISVKLWGSAAAAELIRPLVGADTGILSLQNGVTRDEVLRDMYGDQAVMGGVAYVGAYIDRPGVIHQIGTMQRIVLGEYDGVESPRARFLRDALQAAGTDAECSDDVRRAIWEKFVLLVGLSGATCATRSALGSIRDNPPARSFFLQLMQEVVAVGRAHGVELPPDFADNRLAFADSLPADMDSSMHHDLRSGKRLEIDWLSGAVVELGRQKAVPTPANSAVNAILAMYANPE